MVSAGADMTLRSGPRTLATRWSAGVLCGPHGGGMEMGWRMRNGPVDRFDRGV
jgi:hypothetical protein